MNDSESLDSWVAFDYKFGRFPGSQNLQSPIDLYKKFNAGETKGLVSIQALAALQIHFGGERVVSKNALSEWQYNLLFQVLSKENDNLVFQFNRVGELVYDILHVLLLKENEYVDVAKVSDAELIKKLNETEFKIEDVPEIDLQKEAMRYRKTSLKTPDVSPIKKRPNLNSTIEAAEEKNMQVLREILDPTPGLIANKTFTENDQSRNQDENENNFKLASEAQSALDNLLNDASSSPQIDQPVVEKIPNNDLKSEETEDFYIEDSYIDENPLREIQNYFPQPSTDTRKDFEVTFNDSDYKVSKTVLNTKIVPKKTRQASRSYFKRSPCLLRKGKYDYLTSTQTLKDLELYSKEIPDDETTKINSVESNIDSIVKPIPEHKKLKFNFDENNDIKISVL